MNGWMDFKLVVYEIEVKAPTENFYSIASVNQFQSKLGQSGQSQSSRHGNC